MMQLATTCAMYTTRQSTNHTLAIIDRTCCATHNCALIWKNACATILMSIMSRDKRRNTLFFRTHGMKCCTLFVAEKRCPRNEYSAPGVYRSECQLAPHPGVPQPLNSDRQSTRGRCPNTGRLHIWQRGKFSQPPISDCQYTPCHCRSAGHCVFFNSGDSEPPKEGVDSTNLWMSRSPKWGRTSCPLSRFMELPKGRALRPEGMPMRVPT